jgi:hypothetical protein
MRKKAARDTRALSRREPDTATLIFVELGAAFPAVSLRPGSARRVVAQLEGETPFGFASRAHELVEASFERGVPLGVVAISCNERVDPAAEAARKSLAERSLGRMAAHRAGKLYLAASPRSGGRLRHALSGLVQDLAEQWKGAGLEVKVLFEDERADAEAKPYAWTARVA